MALSDFFKDPSDQLSKHFTWKEALYLPQWKRLADESDGVTDEILQNIKKAAIFMDSIREYFNAPINVHCWLRPQEYNKLVGGAASSWHMTGGAVDFDVQGMSCDEARQKLLDDNKLEELALRMEDNGVGSPWLHLDNKPLTAGHNRYFKP